jgi:hypothetical protein
LTGKSSGKSAGREWRPRASDDEEALERALRVFRRNH